MNGLVLYATIFSYMPFYGNISLLQECNALVSLYFSFLSVVCFVQLLFCDATLMMYLCIVALFLF